MDDALEEGHSAADGEDQDGDDERPEVELLAVPEGVVGVGRLAAASDAEQQEQAVARVDQRVDPLGEHGRAAGYGRGDEFRHGDRQVAGDRCVDPLFEVAAAMVCGPPGWAPIASVIKVPPGERMSHQASDPADHPRQVFDLRGSSQIASSQLDTSLVKPP